MDIAKTMQIIGIIIWVIGGIIVIGKVGDRIKKAKEEALLDFAKVGLIFLLFVLLMDSLPRISKNEKDEKKKIFYKKLENSLSFPAIFSFIIIFFIGFKHSLLKFLELKAVKIGIYLICLGGLTEIVGVILD